MAVPSQLGLSNWSPFHGDTPITAPAIGAAPQGPNPRFPTVGPTQLTPPPGGYQSVIDASPPLNVGQQRQVTKTINPYVGYGKTGGKQSQSAFARALTDNSNASLRSGTSEFGQKFLDQALKSRADDIISQKQNAMDRFRMNSSNATYAADLSTSYDQGIKDLQQNFETQRWNEQTERTAAAIRFMSRMFSMFA